MGVPISVAVEIYSPKRKAEFLLNNAVDQADYRGARKEVMELGPDPDSVHHRRRGGCRAPASPEVRGAFHLGRIALWWRVL